MSLDAELIAALDEREAAGLRRRRRLLMSPQRARVVVDGKPYVAFCSNDYLGLAADPRLIAAVHTSVEQYGVGAGASHLILGHSTAHEMFEQAAAKFVGMPEALLFTTGYMANMGVVSALVGRGDAVFADRLNHASLNDAALISRASFKRYPHLNLVALNRLLGQSTARRKLVVTDTVFSMDGDIAPLPALLELCHQHDAILMIDDAHGFGVLGAQGRGCLAHFGITNAQDMARIVYMATLGKAAGVSGAFVAASAPMVETVMQHARTYIYTTATPPLLSAALLASLQCIESEDWRRTHLQMLIAYLVKALHGSGWSLMPSSTPIQPVVMGTAAAAIALSDYLATAGLLVPAIRPPTVPAGSARLRISLSADHQLADVEQLVLALQRYPRP